MWLRYTIFCKIHMQRGRRWLTEWNRVVYTTWCNMIRKYTASCIYQTQPENKSVNKQNFRPYIHYNSHGSSTSISSYSLIRILSGILAINDHVSMEWGVCSRQEAIAHVQLIIYINNGWNTITDVQAYTNIYQQKWCRSEKRWKISWIFLWNEILNKLL